MTDIHQTSCLYEDVEIRQRARRLGCTEAELREAVKAVASLVALERSDEICDWAMSLCCTEAELRAAVKAAGYPSEAVDAADPLFQPGEFNDV
jgi:Protein of unknown function (DUF3606)